MKIFVSDGKTCMFTFSLMYKLFVRFVKSRKLVFDDKINTIQTCRIINHTWRHCKIKCKTSVKDVILISSMLFSGYIHTNTVWPPSWPNSVCGVNKRSRDRILCSQTCIVKKFFDKYLASSHQKTSIIITVTKFEHLSID